MIEKQIIFDDVGESKADPYLKGLLCFYVSLCFLKSKTSCVEKNIKIPFFDLSVCFNLQISSETQQFVQYPFDSNRKNLIVISFVNQILNLRKNLLQQPIIKRTAFAADFCRKGVKIDITLIPFAPLKCGRRRGLRGVLPSSVSLVRFLSAQEMNIYINSNIDSMPISFAEKK